MAEATQFDPDRLRMVLDHGDVVELDGGTLAVNDEETPSVVLRLAPWRARSVARVLEEWSVVFRVFHRPTRPHVDELQLSRTLEIAAAVLAGGDEPVLRFPRGAGKVVLRRQRLAAVAVLAERETKLSAVQRLALVDAAAWWLSEPSGGRELAYALLGAACSDVTTERVYRALITPSDAPGNRSEGLPS